LKPFSVHGEGKAINLYNADRKATFGNASMKNQCARDYFYGTDVELEKWLGEKERAFAKARDKVDYLGKDSSDEINTLREFVLLQYLRTEAAAHRSVVIQNPADVEALNQHQFLSCATNVYFSRWSDHEKIDRQFHDIEIRRPKHRHELVVAALDAQSDWGKHYRVVAKGDIEGASEILVHTKFTQPPPSQWPSVYSNGSHAGFLRRAFADPERGFRSIR
jgi:hypothetical protein